MNQRKNAIKMILERERECEFLLEVEWRSEEEEEDTGKGLVSSSSIIF